MFWGLGGLQSTLVAQLHCLMARNGRLALASEEVALGELLSTLDQPAKPRELSSSWQVAWEWRLGSAQ